MPKHMISDRIDLPAALRAKAEALRAILRDSPPALLAVSGGIDSRLLAACAKLWSAEARGVVFTGPQFSRAETEYALEFLEGLEMEAIAEPVDTLSMPAVRQNTEQRCYVCKRTLFQAALKRAEAVRAGCVFEGSQRSDEDARRPGRRALRELGIRSPLQEAGFFKEDVRGLATRFGLAHPDQPARPCLLTRFPYGTGVTPEALLRVESLEQALAEHGLRDFRVRCSGIERCLIQVGEQDRTVQARQAERIEALCAEHGFHQALVRLERAVSGFYDSGGPGAGGQ